MFGKLNKLKQATKFAQKAKKGFPMNRRKFLQGLGSVSLSTALPGGLKILPKAMTGEEIKEKYNINFKINDKSLFRPLK
mgnify:CR=1 FL=1